MSLLIESPEADDAPMEEALAEPVTMASLLAMPELRAQLFPVPVEAYHLLTDNLRTELLRGVIFKKLSKSPKHCIYGVRIYKILAAQISPGFEVLPERPLTLSDSEPEPDVVVVRGTEADFADQHPQTAELVVEVAVTSLRLDRAKAAIYAEASVQEYWIVRPATKQVEVYRQPSPSGYLEQQTVAAPAVLRPIALPGVAVDLAELFA
ncbi:MAG TPA: Uma2 family endonuclease [Chthoniobacteraceae bacterium]|jgi:Uma2 family endonuclease|nr:Uma2 family endonuclease [Chthoniobacteraceae bacterium]